MAVSVYLLCLHQLYTTTKLQVDQTSPVEYILDHLLSQRSFKKLNQPDTYFMDAIGEIFDGLVPYHGRTQQWGILL